MGFRLNRTYSLKWDAGDMVGAEIKIRATSTSSSGNTEKIAWRSA